MRAHTHMHATHTYAHADTHAHICMKHLNPPPHQPAPPTTTTSPLFSPKECAPIPTLPPHPFPPTTSRLPDNPSDWLQGASAVTGTRCSAHVGADTADLSAVNEQPLSEWAAPAIPQGHELLLLPDEMYPVVPSTLPFGADTDAGGAGSEGELVFEFGGRMRGARGLRRVRAVYPPGGVASGFEFDVLQMA